MGHKGIGMDMNERLKRMQEKLAAETAAMESRTRERLGRMQQRLEEHMSRPVQTPGGVAQFDFSLPKPVDARVDMSTERSITAVDAIIDNEFEISRHLGASLSAYPTTFCETAREYLAPLVEDIPISDARREQLLDEADAAAQAGQVIPILRSLGVHIPGVGCFINGWIMGQAAGMDPRELLGSPDGFARVLTTASHEKWGHGFITELTASGQEKKAVQLGKHHVADQFDVRTVDTPDHARLSEQWQIIFFSSQYVEEGFATWIERYAAECLAQDHPHGAAFLSAAPSFELNDVAGRLAHGGAAVVDALQTLFSPREVSHESVHAAMAGLVSAVDAMGEDFAHTVGMPGCYALGYCIVDAIARRQGPKCVPYAVATACNVQYGLASVSNGDLRNYVNTHPELNVNTRLALLMFVSSGEKNDIEGFLRRARDEVGITPPLG